MIKRDATYVGHLQSNNSEINLGSSNSDSNVEMETQFHSLQKKNVLQCKSENHPITR